MASPDDGQDEDDEALDAPPPLPGGNDATPKPPAPGAATAAAAAARAARAGKEPGDADEEDLAAPSTDEAPPAGADPRNLYETRYAELDVDARAAIARDGDVVVMRAMAYDPMPRVISALMENPNFSVNEARIIAREHRSGIGLQMLVQSPRLLSDPEVRRRLLRNGHVSAQIIGTLLRGKPLLSIYQVGISHDVPENTKSFARAELRRSFGDRGPEEKVGLILKTDGRVLTLVTGIALDGRAISMIVGRSAMSPMLIRNFAQWPTTPPPILVHMLKLPQVQRDKTLQQAILRHPNVPSQYKRA